MQTPFLPVPDAEALEQRVAASHGAPVVLFQHDPFCGTSAAAHREMTDLAGAVVHVINVSPQELERLVREGRFRMGPPGGEGGATMDAPRMDAARPSRLLAVLPPTPRPEPIPPDPTSLPPTPHPILTPDRPVP